LKQVFTDRVLINNNGVNEILILDGVDSDRGAHSSLHQHAERVRNRKSESIQTDEQKPESLIDYVSMDPAELDGVLYGFELSAGRQPELFTQVGFKDGDLLIGVNGFDLGDPAQQTIAKQEIELSKSWDLVIQRSEKRVSIFISEP
jgi:general secretion pathway protein C